MCSEYGLLVLLTVCKERTIRALFLTVRDSAAVLGRIGHDCESTVALAASFQIFLSPLYSLSKFISEYKSGQSHCCFDWHGGEIQSVKYIHNIVILKLHGPRPGVHLQVIINTRLFL